MLARFAAPNLVRSASSFQIRAHPVFYILVYKKTACFQTVPCYNYAHNIYAYFAIRIDDNEYLYPLLMDLAPNIKSKHPFSIPVKKHRNNPSFGIKKYSAIST